MNASDLERVRMAAFHALDRQQQAEAIQRLAAAGWSERGIAQATQLSVEQICRVLAAVTVTSRAAAAIGTDPLPDRGLA